MRLEVRDVSKKYGRKTVLFGAELSAESGECVGIVGANGSGKSTLLSILAGVLKADSGAFLCDGTDLFRSPKTRSRAVGFVPQGTPLIEELSARDNLFLWYDKKSMEQELNGGMLDLLGIRDFLHMRVSRMSGGMKKRLSIGCAMAGRPPILLLDEPMSALDIVCKQKIKDYLAEYKKAGGILIYVTHDVPELELCDRVYLLKDGKTRECALPVDAGSLLKEIR